MSAGSALQAALAAALSDTGAFDGVYDGPPARAAYPYVSLDASRESDWSHKTGDGREVFAALTVWDEAPAAMHSLADRVEEAVASVQTVEGHELVSLRFLKRRIVRDVAGPWAATVDFRARLLATPS